MEKVKCKNTFTRDMELRIKNGYLEIYWHLDSLKKSIYNRELPSQLPVKLIINFGDPRDIKNFLISNSLDSLSERFP